jgi:hypothetical protein
MNQL